MGWNNVCVTIRGQLIFADTMKKKWEKMVGEWKKRESKQSKNERELVEHTRGEESDNESAVDITGVTPDPEDDDKNTVTSTHVTIDPTFQDDPEAYRSIWDDDDREPYLDYLHLFETILCFHGWVRKDVFWESNATSKNAGCLRMFSGKAMQLQ